MELKKILRKYWWLMVILAILIYIFFPKPCGGMNAWTGTGSKCECIGFSFEHDLRYIDGPLNVFCIGICHSCVEIK